MPKLRKNVVEDKESLIKIARRVKPTKQYLSKFVSRYSQLFASLRDKPVTLLEIGVGGYKNANRGGGSLRMWADYFSNATIIGLDLHQKNLSSLPPNVDLYCGSQTDIVLLEDLVSRYEGFDIVIDDASHMTHKTVTTFETIWSHTRKFYIVEDLHMAKAKGTKEYFQKIDGADFGTDHLCVVHQGDESYAEES